MDRKTRLTCVTLVVILLGAVFYLGYSLHRVNGKLNNIKYSLSNVPGDYNELISLSEAGSYITYQLKENMSSENFIWPCEYFAEVSDILNRDSTFLYEITGDAKYNTFAQAMLNLEEFFNHVVVRAGSRKILKANLQILEAISNELKGVKTLKDISKEKAKTLLELSNKLVLNPS